MVTIAQAANNFDFTATARFLITITLVIVATAPINTSASDPYTLMLIPATAHLRQQCRGHLFWLSVAMNMIHRRRYT